MADNKPKKKSLWEQMGRKVPAMVSDEVLIPKESEEEKKKKKKDKSIWEQTGRKLLY